MNEGDGDEMISIPDEFIRRGSISVADAIRKSSVNDTSSLYLCDATMEGSNLVGQIPQDLRILQAFARWNTEHNRFLHVFRRNYNIDVDFSWEEHNPFSRKDFQKIKTNPLFELFVPEILCKIEDTDMYVFTSFGRLEPLDLPDFLTDLISELPRPHRLEHVQDLFQTSPKLTIVRFMNFLDSVLNSAEACNDSAVNFTLLWNLYKNKHKKFKQSSSQKNVLTRLLSKKPEISAYLSRGQDIWLTRRNTPHQKNMIPIHYQDNRINFKQSQGFGLYKDYLSTFVNSITHAKCATKLTRVSKLYCKPLAFKYKSKKYEYDKTSFKGGFWQKGTLEASHKRWKEDTINSGIKLLINHQTNSVEKILRKSPRKVIINRPQYSDYEPQIIDHEFTTWQTRSGDATIPLVLNGGAGMGKTIRLTQFALAYATDLLRSHEQHNQQSEHAMCLPVFLKAKRCSLIDVDGDEDENSPREVSRFLSSLTEIMVASNPALLNHQTKENLRETIGGWLSNQNLHRSGFVFFIDGLDECSSEEVASKLVRWFTNLGTFQPPTIILSTRPSHYEIAAKILGEHGCVDMLADKEYYSKEELSHEIPMKLCDAWGLTRHSARTLAQVFSSYESILQHPLFVGWFCFLILEDEVEGLEEMDQDSAIARNNLISKIISIGIKSSLERREAEFSGSEDDPASDEFLRILRTFVAVAFHFDLARPEQIYHHMKVYNLAGEISSSIRTSIEEHCGILFLTADNVEWTHRTIPELMYADFYFDHPEIHHWGPLKATSPVVSRLAQLTYENGAMDSYAEAMVRLSFVHDYHYFNELRMDTWIDCENEGRYLIGLDDANNLIPIRDGNHPHEIQMAELFIENLQTISCFPLYYDLLEPSRKRETVQKILTYSNDPFGRDLITPEDEINLVHIDDVRTELVLRTTKIADCFEYYRMILADFRCLKDSKLDLSHDVFSIHKKAQNPEDLFFINHISGWAKYMVLDGGHAMTWLRPWLVNKKSSMDAEFYTEERMELIKFITEEYVETAYRALFGSDHWANLLNTVFEQTREVEIDIVVGSGEYVDVERRNLLNHYMASHNLNDLVSVDSIHQSPANILDNYDTENLFVRGIVMMPFIAECLRFNEGQEDGDLAQFLEEQPNFTAFNIISNYSSRLITKDEQS